MVDCLFLALWAISYLEAHFNLSHGPFGLPVRWFVIEVKIPSARLALVSKLSVLVIESMKWRPLKKRRNNPESKWLTYQK